MLKIDQVLQDLSAAQDTVAELEPLLDQGIGAPAHVIIDPNGTQIHINDGSNQATLNYSQAQLLKAWLNEYFATV